MTDNNTSIEPRNGLGLAALILALIGLVFGLVPLTGFLAVILGITAVALGFAGRGRIRRQRATNRKATWSGIILGVLAIALGIWGIIIVNDAFEQLDDDMQDLGSITEDGYQ